MKLNITGDLKLDKIEFNHDNMFINNQNTNITKKKIEEYKDKIKKAYDEVIAHPSKETQSYFDVVNQETSELENYAKYLQKFDNIVVLGIGGSALGTKAIYSAFAKKGKNVPKLFVKDCIDPQQFADFLNDIEIEKTMFVVVSKSGGTLEVLCQTSIVEKMLKDKLGNSFANNFCVITASKDCALAEWADKNNIKTFYFSQDLSGRFSALSVVGLLPVCACGIDIKQILQGAKNMLEMCKNNSVFDNPALYGAILQKIAMDNGKSISFLMPYVENLAVFAEWYCQLWAESLGKEKQENGKTVNLGQTPVRALGTVDQHSQLQLCLEGPYDKVITFIGVKNFEKELQTTDAPYLPDFARNKPLSHVLNTSMLSTAKALFERGRPNQIIMLPKLNEFYFGELMMYFFLETSFTGALMEINTYNQPSVELIKINVKEILKNDKGIK